MSLFPSEHSVLIPPHYPPHLFAPTPLQPNTQSDSEKTDQRQRRRVAFAPAEVSSISEDSELLLTLHRHMSSRQISDQQQLQTEEESMSLQDLPSGLIRQGLDETVNVAESAREWSDRHL